jgi:AcrR family transcriptional regulator
MYHEVRMVSSASKSADNRVTGKYQVDEQRDAILEAAEVLFLKLGIEKTPMIEIARQAGITRVTLYRYFASRDEIAVEVHMRLMKKTSQIGNFDPQDHSVAGYKQRVQAMIRNFPLLRDRFRYSGMFDKIYLDNPPDSTLTQWTFSQLMMAGFEPRATKEGGTVEPFGEEMIVMMNTVVWFLEKLALRGELTWANKDVPIEEHLRIFEEMMMGYFERLIAAQDDNKSAGSEPAAHPLV